MTVVFARELKDGEVVFAGGARSEIPVAATLLAKRLYAPNITWISPGFINPDPEFIVPGVGDYRLMHGCDAITSFYDVFTLSERGGLDWFFYSGLQIDKYGNINLHYVGDWTSPASEDLDWFLPLLQLLGKNLPCIL